MSIRPVASCDQMSRELALRFPRICANFELGHAGGATLRNFFATLGAAAWFSLNGLLWYARPSPMLWLLGSALLGVIFFAAFLWHVTRD